MATSTFTLPVPWRGENERGLSGVVEITSYDLEKEGITEARVRDLIAIANKKLERMFSSTTGQPEVNCLMFHGVKVRSSSLVEYLVPELMCSSSRLVATTQLRARGRTMTIFVKTLTGNYAVVSCSSFDTVANLKARIEFNEGIPHKRQRLVYAGRVLRDHVKLSDYNIVDAATLQMGVRLLGGLSGGFPPRTFADVSDGSIITAIEFSPSAPEWRRCSKGLNIEGRCMNQECSASWEMIIDPKGFEWFNIIQDDDVKCPVCHCKVKPVTCGLHDCSWRYEGVKKNDDTSMGCPWKDATGYVYHWFDADENHGSVEWASLVLVAKPRNKLKQVSEDDLCSICYSTFGSPVKRMTTTTPCGHTFHRVCSQKWAEYCTQRNTQPSCAICRRST